MRRRFSLVVVLTALATVAASPAFAAVSHMTG